MAGMNRNVVIRLFSAVALAAAGLLGGCNGMSIGFGGEGVFIDNDGGDCRPYPQPPEMARAAYQPDGR